MDSSLLSKIWFVEVDLMTGEWSTIFEYLLKCRRLSYLNPGKLGYTMGGDSPHLRSWNGRRWEDSQALWSVNIPDGNGLEKVVKMLADRAGGVSAYKHQCFYQFEDYGL